MMKEQGARRFFSGDGSGLGRELFGLFAIFCGLLVALSLATFDSRDPWLNHVVSGTARVHNKAGLFGAYLAGLLYDIFGAASWAVPAFLCLAGARRILRTSEWLWWRWTGFIMLGLALCMAGAAGDLGDITFFARENLPLGSGNVSSHGGGIIGHVFYVALVDFLSPVGAFLVWLFCLILALQMLSGISLPMLILGLFASMRAQCAQKTRAVLEKRASQREALLAEMERERERFTQERFALDAPSLPSTAAASRRGPEKGEPEEPWEKDRENEAYADDETGRVGPSPAEIFVQDGTGGRLLDDMVHPLVPRPAALEASLPELLDDADGKVPALHMAAFQVEDEAPPQNGNAEPRLFPEASFSPRAESSEDDLPLWVRDFEEGRVGVRSEAHEAHPRGGGASEPAEDADLLDLLWGPEEEQPPSERQPVSADAPFFTPVTDELLSGGRMADENGREDAPSGISPSSLSAQTAAAVMVLRKAAASEPDMTLHAGPDALTPEMFDEAKRRAAAGSASGLRPSSPAIESAPQGFTASPADFVTAKELESSPALSSGETPLLDRSFSQAPTSPPESSFREPAFTPPLTETQPPASAAPPVPAVTSAPVEHAERPPSTPDVAAVRSYGGLVRLPSLELLQAASVNPGATPREVLEEKGRSLMTCLKDFSIQGELVGITPGPVVTMFEVRPAPGVRVSRIANLSDDLALALKAVAVRIQAPVPGTDTVGIEIPNEVRETVCLKELLGAEVFRHSKSLLTLALGKDIAGNPAVADLATMPHLLVAGATGAGKSVGINSIILSLIYKARPDQVQLLLVDPKRVEMAVYADLPHLVHPVVTEMQLAKNALEWAVSEMEERYNKIARMAVRNIADYNAKLASYGGALPDDICDLEPMPYLVLIIDELADLMLVAAKEVETSIVRLAQLARAAGIHLILATQRPSVDVVTGLIKANFPCRISFQVTSKHDSRTILDTVGAEHLLGKGDMLFKPSGGKFIRMHGAFVSDKDVHAVVSHWKAQQAPMYKVDFADWAPEGSGGGMVSGGGNGGNVSNDPMYNEAVEFVRQQGKASISLIQRKFRIGFNKAARYVEQMEADGIVGPADGAKPRPVIR